ncbi:8662_t:CDS:2, partial [Paraglomus brasilianum]
MAQSVWIRLEDKKRATQFPIVDWNMSHNLDDFATELCKKGRLKTLKIDPADLEFFDGTCFLPRPEINSKNCKRRMKSTLLIRKRKKIIIEDKVAFDCLLQEITPNDRKKIIVDLVVRIKGKKPYGDWNLNEVLNEILHNRYPSLFAMPKLNIVQIKSRAKELTDDNEKTFAVAILRKDYPSLRLAVEQDFDGTRGYGFLDYVIFVFGFLAILVRGQNGRYPKRHDAESRTAPHCGGVIFIYLFKLYHPTSQKLGKRKREEESNVNVYGIVTTGLSWQFIKWSGLQEHLSIEISDVISCGYGDDMKRAKEVLSIISGILQLQADSHNVRQ